MPGLSAQRKKWILIPVPVVIVAAFVLFAGPMTAIAALYGPACAWRVLVYNEAIIRDHERVFPMREIRNRPPRHRAIVVDHGSSGDPMVWAMIARSIIKEL